MDEILLNYVHDSICSILGPFKSQEMSDWFTAGYFTMDLHIRRMCDAMFLPLGKNMYM